MAGEQRPEVVEGGAPPPRRSTRAIAVLVAVALAGYAIYSVVSDTGSAPQGAPATPHRAPASGQPAGPVGRGHDSCGTLDLLPVADPRRLDDRPSGRLLVGGRGLRSLDLETGRVSQVPGMGANEAVLDLRRGADTTYVLSQAVELCSYRRTFAYRLHGGRLQRLPGAGTADALLTGPQGAWLQAFGTDGAYTGLALRPLQDGPTLRPHGYPVADTGAGIVVESGGTPDTPRLALLAPDGHKIRDLGRGVVYGVSHDGRLLVADTDCGRRGSCGLTTRDTASGRGGPRIFVPHGRSVVSPAVFGPHGHFVAMLLSRRQDDPRWRAAHPGPPADVAVLNLDTGDWLTMPDLELPPKSQAALAFDGTGEWVLVGVDYGDRTRIFGWHLFAESMGVVADLPGDNPVSPALLTLP